MFVALAEQGLQTVGLWEGEGEGRGEGEGDRRGGRWRGDGRGERWRVRETWSRVGAVLSHLKMHMIHKHKTHNSSLLTKLLSIPPLPSAPSFTYHCISWVVYVVNSLADGVGEQALCRSVVGFNMLLSIPHCDKQPKGGPHVEKVLHLYSARDIRSRVGWTAKTVTQRNVKCQLQRELRTRNGPLRYACR